MATFPSAGKVAGVSTGLTSDLNTTYSLLQSILGSYVLPSGDTTGATDTPLMQVALNAGYLRLLPGAAYYTNQVLEFPGYCVIEGGGANEGSPGRLIMANGTNLNAVLASAGWNASSNTTSLPPVTIRNLQIDANRGNQGSGSGHGLVLQNAYSRIEDVTVRNSNGDGIRFDFFGSNGTTGITNTMVENRIIRCKILGAGVHGISTTDPVSGSAITDGFIEGCIIQAVGVGGTGGNGINLSNAAGWLIRGNHLYSLPQHGIQATRAFNTRIVENYVEQCGQGVPVGTYRSIYANNIQFREGVIIAGNDLEVIQPPGNSGTTLRAIETATAGGSSGAVTITGNHMYCNQTTGAVSYDAIVVTNGSVSSATDAVTTGNNITGSWTTTLTLTTAGGTINHTAGV